MGRKCIKRTVYSKHIGTDFATPVSHSSADSSFYSSMLQNWQSMHQAGTGKYDGKKKRTPGEQVGIMNHESTTFWYEALCSLVEVY
jgi:hypothetical protein